MGILVDKMQKDRNDGEIHIYLFVCLSVYLRPNM